MVSPGKFEISIETSRHHTHPLVCIAHNNRPSILYKFIRINTFYWTRNTSSIIFHKNLLFAIYINLNWANFHCAHKAVNENISFKKLKSTFVLHCVSRLNGYEILLATQPVWFFLCIYLLLLYYFMILFKLFVLTTCKLNKHLVNDFDNICWLRITIHCPTKVTTIRDIVEICYPFYVQSKQNSYFGEH